MREEVSKALNSCKDNSAPGPSQVTYKVVKWAWEAHSLTLWYLYSHCIDLGHYPSLFKSSITAVASKLNKNNYTDPSSFRPIQLTECPGKVLKIFFTKQIQYEVANHNIVPGTQFGGQSHLSTLNVGLSLSQDIHNAWDRGLKATALMFDISGFFNFVNHDILIWQLTSFGFNPKPISLIKGFLTGHHTQISYDLFISNPHNIPNSIPQGSPLSPILSILYSNPLLTIRELTLCRISTLAYMDDGVLCTSSSLYQHNQTPKCLPSPQESTYGHQLENSTKKAWSHALYQRTRPGKPSLPPTWPWLTHNSIYISPLAGLPPGLPPHPSHQTSGCQSDQDNYTMHILGNIVKGMSHPQLRTLTLSTITPILMYGCQLWWGGRFSKSNTNCLQMAINGTLRLICRGFCSTLVYTLQHISHIWVLHSQTLLLCIYLSSQTSYNQPHPHKNTPKIKLIFDNSLTRHWPDPSKKSPLAKIAELTNTMSTPTLNPLYKPP